MTALLLACPICFGDPNSNQAQGARLGVLFMLGVTAVMLAAIALVARTWMLRAQQLEVNVAASPSRHASELDEGTI